MVYDEAKRRHFLRIKRGKRVVQTKNNDCNSFIYLNFRTFVADVLCLFSSDAEKTNNENL